MGLKRKHIIIVLSITLAVSLAFIILNMLYRDSQTTKINCVGSRGNVYSYDSEYYIIQNDGIYAYPDKKLVSVENCESITADKDYIYTTVHDRKSDTYSIVIYDRTTGKEIKGIAADEACSVLGAAEGKLYLVYHVADKLCTLDLEKHRKRPCDL